LVDVVWLVLRFASMAVSSRCFVSQTYLSLLRKVKPFATIACHVKRDAWDARSSALCT
jgi:hypothetical protein